ncbi:MFS transporter [Pseudomonas putida]|uniref:MFS transporter n=1 Tax=Pseudomonas putida TaxID=303 RepID=UPI0009824E16|nr:MFS transporter [Pseudomonas putida]OMQ39376.1 MFS transporter [Pseudomonas putida]
MHPENAIGHADLLDATYRKITWRLLPYLFVSYVFAYLDRVNIGFAAVQMKADLNFSDAVYGLGAGMFFVGYFMCEIPSNLLMNKIGARLTIARIMICWGLVSCCTMLVTSSTSFYLVRLLLGIFEAGFAPGVLLYLTLWYPPARRAQMAAIFLSGAAIAGVVGAPISGWILDAMDEAGGLHGWQWLFMMEGVPSVLLGALALLLLPDRPSAATWLSHEEKAQVTARLATPTSKASHGFIDALRDPVIYYIAIAWFTVICGIYSVSFWMPMLMQDAGIKSSTEIGLWSIIPYGATAIGMVLVSRHSDKTMERRWHAAACALLGAVGLALLPFVHGSFLLTMLSLTLASTAVFSAMPITLAMPMCYLSSKAAPGGIAFVNTIGLLGGVVSPYMLGLIKTNTGSLDNGLFVIAAMLLIGALLLVGFVRLEPRITAVVA